MIKTAYNNVRGDIMPIIYKVKIHPCVDTTGYWAECVSLPGCFTDGETIQETQSNMYESISLFLRDDYPEITEYSLLFEVENA
jgi:predicted RNase H-like HicB family nuclease